MNGPREYALDSNLRWCGRGPRLDSSDYQGNVLFRGSPVTRDAPVRPEREAPGRDGAGLSQTHSLTALKSRPRGELRHRAQVEIWEGGTLVRIQRDLVVEESKGGGKRGKVLNFSAQSRRNMLRLLNRLQKEALPLFITLTLPGKTAIGGDQLNTAFHRLRMAFKRTFPGCSAVWKKELADRKSGEFEGEWLPHFHFLAWGLPHKFPYRPYKGKWVSVTRENDMWVERIWAFEDGTKILRSENRMEARAEDRFTEWLSRMWYEFVSSGEASHFSAGTAAERIMFATGVKRYAAKYLGKEQLGAGNEYAVGRYWGIWNKENLPWASRKVFECSDRQAVQLMRIARRYFESKTKRKARLGHSVINLFVNESEQWKRLIVLLTGDG